MVSIFANNDTTYLFQYYVVSALQGMVSIYANNDTTYLFQYYVVSGDVIPPRNGKYLC